LLKDLIHLPLLPSQPKQNSGLILRTLELAVLKNDAGLPVLQNMSNKFNSMKLINIIQKKE
jgi:hypothetical protein